MIKETILKYHTLSSQAEHHRFKSWEHCYCFFQKNYKRLNIDEVLDHASLHLAFYLASWGMLRGSSFLLQKDYKVHTYFLKSIVMNPQYSKFFIDDNDCDYIGDQDFKGFNELIHETKRVYLDNIHEINGEKTIINVTDTLASKILLGVYGIVPAYDRYFKDGLNLYGMNTQFNERSFAELAGFYHDNKKEFNEMKNLFSDEGVQYTQMKLVYMYFWQVGFMMDNHELFRDELKFIASHAEDYQGYRQTIPPEKRTPIKSRIPKSVGLTQEIRDYIILLLDEAKSDGEAFLELRSGDIHKELGLKDRLPSVCGAMESIPGYKWTKLSDSPSGKSTTKVLRYHLTEEKEFNLALKES